MKKKISLVLLLFYIINYSFAQTLPIRIITAPNVGLHLQGKKELPNYWIPMHRLPLDFVFKCKIWKNKDLSITFSDTAKAEQLRLTHEYDDFVKELPQEINGYKLFGAYERDDIPWNVFFVVYLSAKRPNSYLYVAQSIDGVVYNAAYYSDDNLNPFQDMDLLAKRNFKTKALITHDNVAIERTIPTHK